MKEYAIICMCASSTDYILCIPPEVGGTNWKLLT